MPIGVNIILAVSLNLTVGFLGELTLGHAGFMSVGAYAGCLFTIYCNLPVWIEFPLALIIGGLVAAIFGVIIGIPALRLNGDYLAIVTLAFGEIIRSVLNNVKFTGGAGGLKGIDKTSNFTIAYILVFLYFFVGLRFSEILFGVYLVLMVQKTRAFPHGERPFVMPAF